MNLLQAWQQSEALLDEGYIAIGRIYAKRFTADQELVKGMVGKMPSVRLVLSEVYTVLVRQGKCEDITKLPEEDKRELWVEAQAWCDIKNKKVLHQVCKSIIAIGALI